MDRVGGFVVRAVRALLNDINVLGLAILRWVLTVAACIAGVLLAAIVTQTVYTAFLPGGLRPVLVDDLAYEAWGVGGLCAFVTMLLVGLCARFGMRRLRGFAWVVLFSSVAVAAIVVMRGHLDLRHPDWPSFLAPPFAAFVGLGAWRLLRGLLDAASYGLETLPDADGAGVPDADPSFDV